MNNLKGIDLDLPKGRLIVICGRSGSGKSSLAIDTLYAEGQRRYIETFSAHTRQFLEKFEKPDALRIDGIPASVAVTGKFEPKFYHGTVGNATGIADYLRLLFAKIGHPFCPNCNNEISINSPEKILNKLLNIIKPTKPTSKQSDKKNTSIIETKIQIVFEPTVPTDRNIFIQTWRERGFIRCVIFNQTLRIDENEITPELYDQLLQTIKHDKSNLAGNHNNNLNDKRKALVLILVDRLSAGDIDGVRFVDSVRTAYRYGDDKCCILLQNAGEIVQLYFAQQLYCANCRFNFPPIEPQLFNPESPMGVCPECCGGSFSRVGAKSKKDDSSLNISKLRECSCGGSNLRVESRMVRIGGKNIVELGELPTDILRNEISELASNLPDYEQTISKDIISQVEIRLKFLDDVGLGYLSMSRLVNTLSSGEVRRVYLSGALGSSLVEIMYVLDEPSVGLHPCDSERLLNLIYKLRDNGNTVIVVEHEEIFLRGADHLVEIGLGAGNAGGNVIFQGTPDEMINSSRSLTGKYLKSFPIRLNFLETEHANATSKNGRSRAKTTADIGSDINHEKNDLNTEYSNESNLKVSKLDMQSQPQSHKTIRGTTGRIRISGCCGNNLRDVSVSFPLGQLCVVTGVSGAGKSTLVFDTLYPAVCAAIGKKPISGLSCGLQYGELSLSGKLTNVTPITQAIPIKTGRSNPATYLKIFDGIRAVFASTAEARLRNYGAGRFSFNVSGGRCENCLGEGFLTVDMQFMSDMYIRCPECRGRRYRSDTLEVLYRGKNISEVLGMTVREAFIFFRGQVKLQKCLKRMIDVGLDYIQIGQRLDTLSGGELQRLKLASYLIQVRGGNCLLLFDEPTTGLHFADIAQLLTCFGMLIDMGHSLIVIEHNLQVIKAADHIIDIGPGAADQGGKIIAEGTPKELSKNKNSKIGKYI
ncbi:MAG: excinuclease ABC subunit UvrA [Planctomycetaceae bacterium]|nr:excinuclease ABC subunit UvrA [Planctomycetaceae bacterium]